MHSLKLQLKIPLYEASGAATALADAIGDGLVAPFLLLLLRGSAVAVVAQYQCPRLVAMWPW